MSERKPPISWDTTIFFLVLNLAAVTLVPWWGITQGYSGWAWAGFFGLFALTGLGITVGYHRLWAHRSFKARLPLRIVLAVFGGMALQNSIYNWAARHRVHHRHVDDVEHDPHSIKSGFWHAHMGWMVRRWPASEADYSKVPDLPHDPVVMWQHRYYWSLVWISNIGIPLALGFLVGDPIGMLLLAGVLRLAASQHFTFFINSLAHTWGKRPYSEENTAVDNGLIALLTWGEGYHNYHHAFQNDYRNGVRWWQYDPSKWVIRLCAWLGLAHDLRRTPNFKIQRARLDLQFRKLRERAEKGNVPPTWRETLEQEYQHFKDTVTEWQQLQMRRVEAGKTAVRDRWVGTELRTSFKELDYRLKMQRLRLRALLAAFSG